ncbi:MAG: hypothetical protein LBN71_02525 [Tannerella sp.]|jgi:3-oxoacyl-(acyl-carrier-protein) synthase|nr:hypothetical protein [Tannerella sp.]
MSVYIQAATQISAQKPLSDEWFDSPVYPDKACIHSNDPAFTDYLSPLMSRRMCNLLKRAIVTARLTLKKASVEMPDAIISGTGLGCIENTEKFLTCMLDNGEQFLQPSYFMQSTHNILSSSIAIDLKCHGYNNTFVHRGVSFEHALTDAILQFRLHGIQTALVGGYDELTADYHLFFSKLGLFNFAGENTASPKERCFAGETAVSMLLSASRNDRTLCEISETEMMYRPSKEQMRQSLNALLGRAGCSLSEIDAVLVGTNTNPANDAVYQTVIPQLFGNHPVAQYKHLFGQSITSPALGVYTAATCLHRQMIPSHLLLNRENDLSSVKRILFYNHFNNKSHSLILLSQC